MSNPAHYLFSSPRLGYRPVMESDFNNLLKLDSDPEVRAFFSNGTLNAIQLQEQIVKDIAYFHEKKFGIFIATELTSGEIVGRCGFGEIPAGEIEVGYVFFKKFWGQGLASEALSALLEWAKKNINIDKIIAYAPIDHVASHRVMEKSGMQYYKDDIAYGLACKFYKKEL